MMYGIDISEHNGYIDLSPYVGKFVIIRCAWGTNEDKMWRRNVTECQRLGIPFGLYLYSYAISVEGAETEANFFLNLTAGLDIKVGNWYDMEDADGYKANHGAMDSDLISAMCRKFCSIVQAAGRYVGIYASQSWFGTWIKDCDAYDKWVASWGNNDGNVNRDTSDMGTMLQYTSNQGRLDENIMYVDISTYDMSGNKPTPAPEPQPEPTPAAPEGTTLELVAKVMQGEFGNGDDRKNALGSRYDEVQGVIDHIASTSVSDLADEVIAGKYGDNSVRETVLGDRYNAVQAAVNERYQPNYDIYVVQAGDTLSAIADKFGTNHQKIAEDNNLENPNLIYPGQRLVIK